MLYRWIYGIAFSTAISLTVAAAIVVAAPRQLADLRVQVFIVAALIGVCLGLVRLLIRARGPASSGSGESPAAVTNMAVTLFHLGAIITFVFGLAKVPIPYAGYPYGFGRASFIGEGLINLVIAYAIFRVWTMVARSCRQRLGREPAFVLGLYAGCFPTLLNVMALTCFPDRFEPLRAVLLYLGFASYIWENHFVTWTLFYDHFFVYLSGRVLLDSIAWALLFTIGAALRRRWRGRRMDTAQDGALDQLG